MPCNSVLPPGIPLRVMDGRKESSAGTTSLLPLNPQERTSSGAAVNTQLCASMRSTHAH